MSYNSWDRNVRPQRGQRGGMRGPRGNWRGNNRPWFNNNANNYLNPQQNYQGNYQDFGNFPRNFNSYHNNAGQYRGGHYQNSSQGYTPLLTTPLLRNPLRLPTKPPTPLPGTEEYTQSKIQQTSEFIKRHLNLSGSGNDIPNVQENLQTGNSTIVSASPLVRNEPKVDTQNELSNSLQKKQKPVAKPKVNKNIDVKEICDKIVHHISNLNLSKKMNLVNRPGASSYDFVMQQVQKQKRLELSRALRNMSNKTTQDSEDKAVINSIIPDFGIKLEDLPLEVIAELSTTLNCEVEDIQNNLLDPEIFFKQAQELCENFDSTSCFDLTTDDDNAMPVFPSSSFDENILDVNNTTLIKEESSYISPFTTPLNDFTFISSPPPPMPIKTEEVKEPALITVRKDLVKTDIKAKDNDNYLLAVDHLKKQKIRKEVPRTAPKPDSNIKVDNSSKKTKLSLDERLAVMLAAEEAKRLESLRKAESEKVKQSSLVKDYKVKSRKSTTGRKSLLETPKNIGLPKLTNTVLNSSVNSFNDSLIDSDLNLLEVAAMDDPNSTLNNTVNKGKTYSKTMDDLIADANSFLLDVTIEDSILNKTLPEVPHNEELNLNFKDVCDNSINQTLPSIENTEVVNKVIANSLIAIVPNKCSDKVQSSENPMTPSQEKLSDSMKELTLTTKHDIIENIICESKQKERKETMVEVHKTIKQVVNFEKVVDKESCKDVIEMETSKKSKDKKCLSTELAKSKDESKMKDKNSEFIESSKTRKDEHNENVEISKTVKVKCTENVETFKSLKDTPSENVQISKTVKDKPSDNVEISKTIKGKQTENVESLKTLKDKPSDNVEISKTIHGKQTDNVESFKTLKDKPSENVENFKTIKDKQTENVESSKTLKDKSSENIETPKTITVKQTENIESLKDKPTENVDTFKTKDKSIENVESFKTKDKGTETVEIVKTTKDKPAENIQTSKTTKDKAKDNMETSKSIGTCKTIKDKYTEKVESSKTKDKTTENIETVKTTKDKSTGNIETSKTTKDKFKANMGTSKTTKNKFTENVECSKIAKGKQVASIESFKTSKDKSVKNVQSSKTKKVITDDKIHDKTLELQSETKNSSKFDSKRYSKEKSQERLKSINKDKESIKESKGKLDEKNKQKEREQLVDKLPEKTKSQVNKNKTEEKNSKLKFVDTKLLIDDKYTASSSKQNSDKSKNKQKLAKTEEKVIEKPCQRCEDRLNPKKNKSVEIQTNICKTVGKKVQTIAVEKRSIGLQSKKVESCSISTQTDLVDEEKPAAKDSDDISIIRTRFEEIDHLIAELESEKKLLFDKIVNSLSEKKPEIKQKEVVSPQVSKTNVKQAEATTSVNKNMKEDPTNVSKSKRRKLQAKEDKTISEETEPPEKNTEDIDSSLQDTSNDVIDSNEDVVSSSSISIKIPINNLKFTVPEKSKSKKNKKKSHKKSKEHKSKKIKKSEEILDSDTETENSFVEAYEKSDQNSVDDIIEEVIKQNMEPKECDESIKIKFRKRLSGISENSSDLEIVKGAEISTPSSRKRSISVRETTEHEDIKRIKVEPNTSQSNLERSEFQSPVPLKNLYVNLTRLDVSPFSTHQTKNVAPENPLKEVTIKQELPQETSVKVENVEADIENVTVKTENSSVTVNSSEADINKNTSKPCNNDLAEYSISYKNFRGVILVVKIIDNTMISASDEGFIYVYNWKTGELIYTMKVASKPLTSITVLSSSEKTVALGALDGRMSFYNLQKNDVFKTVIMGDAIQCMEHAWNFIFCGTYRGSIIRYSLAEESEQTHKISEQSVLMVKASQEGSRKILLVASRNCPVTIRDAMSCLLLRTISFPSTVYTLLLHNSVLYFGTSQHDILVYSFHDGAQLCTYKASKGVVCMQIVGNLLFAACYDGNLYVFNIKTNESLGILPGPGGLLLSLAIVDDHVILGSKNSHLICKKIPQHFLDQK